MPADKFLQRLLVIPLRVNRRAAVRRQMREEFLNPLVADFSRPAASGSSTAHV